MIEELGILAGVIFGTTGMVLSIVEVRRQRKLLEEQNKEIEKQKKLLEIKEEKEEIDKRLNFLAGIILNQSLSIKHREGAYEEYKKLGGNSSVEVFWLQELERLDK